MSQGHDRLWCWFGLDRASWLTMPRVMMHAMPDDWQERMAALLDEWDDKWDIPDELPTPNVSARGAGEPVYLSVWGNGHPPVYVGVKGL